MNTQWANCSHYWINDKGECLLCGGSDKSKDEASA